MTKPSPSPARRPTRSNRPGLRATARRHNNERHTMADLDKLVEELGRLTVIEAADLVKKLEEAWGVTAAAPVAVAAGPAVAAEAAPAEEKTEFDVILKEVPAPKKISVIKAVRVVKAGLGLADAKALVEGAPKPVLEAAPKEEAENAKKTLEEAGAVVEIK